MGESACLLQQPFSYASGFPNDAKEVNPNHALGQSISFGRFMSESLAWEKWSTFSHKKYVEEAERYSRPGSVAQKKAFFEAHYKKIAAQKAAALLEQANAAPNDSNPSVDFVDKQEAPIEDVEAGVIVDTNGVEEVDVLNAHQVFDESPVPLISQTENTEMEKPLLKKDFDSKQEDLVIVKKKKPAHSSLRSLIYNKASKIPPTPAKSTGHIHPKKENNNATPVSKKSAIDSLDKRKSASKAIHKSINFMPARELNKHISTTVIRKSDSSKVASTSKASKDCVTTPLRTPNMACVNGVAKNFSTTPCSESRGAKTPVNSSTSRSKMAGSKWRFLATDCSKFLSTGRDKSETPTMFTPFNLRTEERAARRKEKLEDRFNANEMQKLQLHTKLREKEETEIKKLRQRLCFKARPLPDFYKERVVPENQIKMVPSAHPQSPKLGRKSTPSMLQGTPSLPSRKPSLKNKDYVSKKNGTTCPLISGMISYENASPNIQHG